MRHNVELTHRAEVDIDREYVWLHERSPSAAGRWYDELIGAIAGLDRFPRRCPLAPESRRLGKEIRSLLVGSHRVLFEGVRGRVRVLHVRHTAQRPLRPGDV